MIINLDPDNLRTIMNSLRENPYLHLYLMKSIDIANIPARFMQDFKFDKLLVDPKEVQSSM